jgi:hypothetical protein
VPLIPLKMLRGTLPVSTQIANVCVGMAAYAVRTPILSTSRALQLTKCTVPFYSPAYVPSDPPGLAQ